MEGANGTLSFDAGFSRAVSLTRVSRPDLPSFAQYPDIILDAMESTSGWSGSALDSVDFKSGRASLKRSDATPSRFYRALATPLDVSHMRFLTFWYYVSDPSKLGGSDQQVEIGSAGTYDREERNWPVVDIKLRKGWNFVVLDIAGARHRTVNGVQANLTRINWFRIYHQPTAAVTTKIDQVVFTNRLPASLAFSQYLDRKESLLRHPDGAGLAESGALAETLRLSVSDARRQRECRAVRLQRQQRAVSQYTLDPLGVGSGGASKLQLMEVYLCGTVNLSPSSPSFDTIVNSMARDYVTAEVDLVNTYASRFGISVSEAAEHAEKLFEFDRARVQKECGTDPVELNNYLLTGAAPAGIVGPNPLFRNCSVTSQSNLPQEIAVRIGGGRSLTGAGDRYAACWEEFSSQASDCNDPRAAPIDDFDSGLQRIPGYRDNPERRQRAHDLVSGLLDTVESVNLAEANDLLRQRNEGLGFEDMPLVDDTQPRSGAPNRDELVELHKKFDDERGRAQYARSLESTMLEAARAAASTDPDQALARSLAAETFHQVASGHEAKASEIQDEICRKDAQDPICKGAPPPPAPQQPTPAPDKPDAGPNPGQTRCAEFDVGGEKAYYRSQPTPDGGTHELNSVDRIEHCLCDVFDRQYPDLPEFMTVAGVNVNSFCPDPQERIMHECTEPGWDDGPPSRECLFGLDSPKLDNSALTARICWAMRSATCPDPRLLANGECNCFTLGQTGGGSPPPRQCAQVINCGPDSVPDDQGCGCRPLGPPQTCAGNVTTLTQPIVNTFTGVTALAGRPVLSVSTSAPLVTRAVTPAQLTNGNLLNFNVYNANSGGAMSATADVRCTNLQAGVSNYLVDRVSLAALGSGLIDDARVQFSGSDLDHCFGTSRTNSSYLEIGLTTSRAVPRLAFVADADFGRILEPPLPTQPCTIPTIGPIPRPTWNLSTGQVLRTDLAPAFPQMLASGLIVASAVVPQPVYFAKSYAPSSLALVDRTTPVTSQIAVTRQGPVSSLTLQLRLRGDWLPGRFQVTLVAPNGDVVYDESGLGSTDPDESNAETFDGGIVVRLDEAVETQGTWTLRLTDVGGNLDNLKSGDLYNWSLNFNPVEAWDSEEPEAEPPADPGGGSGGGSGGGVPAGWSCNGRDGFEDFPGQFYGDGGCDCGCGAIDVDCPSNNVSACEYVFCQPGHNVNPSNIGACL